jgi:hypothetical protein
MGEEMAGELHKQNIHSELSGFFSHGHTEGTITNGRFEYDEATLQGLVTDWMNLATNYDESLQSARGMAAVKGPGKDFASTAQAAAANASGDSYLAYLEQNHNYCTNQAQLFQNALDDYLGIEHRNVTEINKSDKRGPQPGI